MKYITVSKTAETADLVTFTEECLNGTTSFFVQCPCFGFNRNILVTALYAKYGKG